MGLKEHLAGRAFTPQKREGGAFSSASKWHAGGKVKESPSLKRILDIPRREWGGTAEDESMRQELSAALRLPGGAAKLAHHLGGQEAPAELFAIQARALEEMYQLGGLFAPIVVGGGKTLISYLAPTALEAKRPLLLVPANLRDKTRRDFELGTPKTPALCTQWTNPPPIHIMSYEKLSREKGEQELIGVNPDLIISDECHRLKNKKAACTRRVNRYMMDRPETHFVAMSGTVTSRSLKDFAHILAWCLPDDLVPLPHRWNALVEWCQAIDEKTQIRLSPGALSQLYNDEEKAQHLEGQRLSAVRSAVRRRIIETPGVVATSDAQLVGSSLTVDAVVLNAPDEIAEAFEDMREMWITPSGIPIASPLELWRKCSELGDGFVYRWDPAAPEDWMDARRSWSACVRHIIEHNSHGLDSALPVFNAVNGGLYDGKVLKREGMPIHRGTVDGVLKGWLEVRDTFRPNAVADWLSSYVVDYAAKWMKTNKGVVWGSSRAFCQKLAEVTGAPYFANGGKEVKTRAAFESHDPAKGSVIASIASNAEGRNLQAWSRGLVVGPMSNGKAWEQLLGRKHRRGQTADEVRYTVVLTCAENVNAMAQSMADAEYIQSGHQAQKLCYADVTFWETLKASKLAGPQWHGWDQN